MRAIGVLVFALAVAWSGVAPLNADLATVGGQAPTCNINGHCTGTGGGNCKDGLGNTCGAIWAQCTAGGKVNTCKNMGTGCVFDSCVVVQNTCGCSST